MAEAGPCMCTGVGNEETAWKVLSASFNLHLCVHGSIRVYGHACMSVHMQVIVCMCMLMCACAFMYDCVCVLAYVCVLV